MGLCCYLPSATTTGLLVAVVSLFAYFIWRSQQVFKTFKKIGMPGPKPSFMVGNMGEMTKKGFHAAFKDWEKEYGKIYGMYRAKDPAIVVHEPEILKHVMVKMFATFPNRQETTITDRKPFDTILQFTKDDHWRFLRKSLSPAFSSGKLKQMLPVIKRSCRNLVTVVGQKAASGQEVDLKVLCNDYSMDVTAGTGFGLEINCLLNPEEEFSKVTTRILYPPQYIFTLFFLFPYLTPFFDFIGLRVFPKKDVDYMNALIRAAIKDRRQSKSTSKDFLQQLVDFEKGEGDLSVDPELDFDKDLSTESTWKRKGLTEDEIETNSLNFILAGFENTAAAIAFLLYNLAGTPECLQKLQEEVDKVFGEEEIDYRAVNNMPYLDMCLNESLRLYPPGLLVDRTCKEDTDLPGGLHVKAGMLITIPIYSLHTDPTYWPDPLKFDPERFTPEAVKERHPFSFMPFGHGPRNCIGMRMSQMEAKMAVAAIVQKFNPVLTDKSEFPAVISNHIRLSPVSKMWVKFQPRS